MDGSKEMRVSAFFLLEPALPDATFALVCRVLTRSCLACQAIFAKYSNMLR